MSNSKIEINVSTDDNKVPENINWTATDGGVDQQNAKAMLLAMWDEKDQNTLRIDLWTKEMQIDEMKQFFHQTLVTMADTFERVTGESNICEDLRDYCHHFAEKMEILPEQQ